MDKPDIWPSLYNYFERVYQVCLRHAALQVGTEKRGRQIIPLNNHYRSIHYLSPSPPPISFRNTYRTFVGRVALDLKWRGVWTDGHLVQLCFIDFDLISVISIEIEFLPVIINQPATVQWPVICSVVHRAESAISENIYNQSQKPRTRFPYRHHHRSVIEVGEVGWSSFSYGIGINRTGYV